ncbi:3'(2'),5'-bisphosphate nucleotidase CysQ [Glutamicibacter arilaitensis]|uniref:3'(2'),5'-bisphosphate nucleotidase CysQ n=1 Tax=Glutamicibacter arilaitensis TaxID=256701 RepID=UPI003FD24B5C
MGDLEHARALAQGAGQTLMRLRAAAGERGLAGKALKDAGDRAAQDYLSAELRRLYPSDAVLSEESEDTKERLNHRRVWIIDPLDGTREYSEFRDDWAVHVALWEDGRLAAGAVSLPGVDMVLDSAMMAPLREQLGQAPIRIAVSRSRPPAVLEQLTAQLDIELVPMGSAGYKVCAVVRGEVDAYIHAGGQYEWDSAAPVAVAAGSGLHASRIDGKDLEYNQVNPYLPDLLVCRPELKDLLLDHIAAGLKSITTA